MGTWLKNLWSDQTVFFGTLRGLLFAIAAAAASGALNPLLEVLPENVRLWVGPALALVAGFMRSSSSPSVPELPKPAPASPAP